MAKITVFNESCQLRVMSAWEVKPVKPFHLARNKVMMNVHSYSFQQSLIPLSLLNSEMPPPKEL